MLKFTKMHVEINVRECMSEFPEINFPICRYKLLLEGRKMLLKTQYYDIYMIYLLAPWSPWTMAQWSFEI